MSYAGKNAVNINTTYSTAIGTAVAAMGSISITPGSYIIGGTCGINGGSYTSLTAVISTSSASLTPFITGASQQTQASATAATGLVFADLPITVTSNTTLYLNAGVGASSTTASGTLTATPILKG